MSASEEVVQKIGILAGGGDMPRLLVEACHREGIEPFVLGFKGQSDFGWLGDAGVEHDFVAIGKAGAVIKRLRAQGLTNLVMLGTIRKPSMVELMPDLKAMQFLVRHGYGALGDDGLLRALRGFLEREGFVLHGAQRFMPEILMTEDVVGSVGFEGFEGDVEVGVAAALALGEADEGQSVLVCGGAVIAREGRSGTDAMILEYGCAGAVLVKMCKPQQDRDLDLPTIGAATVRNVVETGCAGIVVHAGASFFLDREEAVVLADEAGVFIVGVTL